MKIIISNDDGVFSPGIMSIAEVVSKKYHTTIIAPDGNRSGYAHSMTLHKPFNVKEIDANTYLENRQKIDKIYSISGTPVDCIKFAKVKLNRVTEDIIVSGINSAYNLGTDIMYSGTVAIGCEASFYQGISFCFSCNTFEKEKLQLFSKFALKIIETFTPISKKGDIWNINFPNTLDILGIKVTKLGKQIYSDEYVSNENGFTLTGQPLIHNENDEDCDVEWVNKGYISITPISFDRTCYDRINEVKNICIK